MQITLCQVSNLHQNIYNYQRRTYATSERINGQIKQVKLTKRKKTGITYPVAKHPDNR